MFEEEIKIVIYGWIQSYFSLRCWNYWQKVYVCTRFHWDLHHASIGSCQDQVSDSARNWWPKQIQVYFWLFSEDVHTWRVSYQEWVEKVTIWNIKKIIMSSKRGIFIKFHPQLSDSVNCNVSQATTKQLCMRGIGRP